VAEVTGWAQHVDDLAGALADLLTDTTARTTPLVDATAALACRDTVVVQLRQMVGAVAGVLPVAEARPLQLFDLTHRPAQALQQSLAELPRASQFGEANVDIHRERGLPPYEQCWREAARTAVALEKYVYALGQIPDEHSWSVLRDLADLSAALPALDHGLSEAILPWLKGGEDLGVPYAALTSPGHDAVRVCSSEIRSRIPAVPPSTEAAPVMSPVLGTGDLDRAMSMYVRTVLDRGAELSFGDLRAVTRVLRFGGAHAAVALKRAAPALPGAGDAAAALRQVGPPAERLRDSPAKTLGPDRLDVLRDSGELLSRMRALATQERQLPGGASDSALHALAAPALEFARHVPNLGRALELGVREALADGLMLVPSSADEHNSTNLLWVTSQSRQRGWRDGVPQVQQDASAVARAAEAVGPGVRTATAALVQHQEQVVDPARQAAAKARQHLGAARAQLRDVLTAQAGRVPPPLSSPLPSHPRLAPDAPTRGR
jgi:hypothetical protein